MGGLWGKDGARRGLGVMRTFGGMGWENGGRGRQWKECFARGDGSRVIVWMRWGRDGSVSNEWMRFG